MKNKKIIVSKETKRLNDLVSLCLLLPDEEWREVQSIETAEEWKKYRVPDRLQGVYFVSNRGNVISLYNDVPLLLTQTPKNKRGYKQITINGKKIDIHILVAENFLGDTQGKEVHHKDTNPQNNNVDNLEIQTHEQHLLTHGKKPKEVKQ